MEQLNVTAHRDDTWWVLEFTAPDGTPLGTQVQHLHQAQEMVLDALGMVCDVPEDITISITPYEADAPIWGINESRQLSVEIQTAERRLSSMHRDVVTTLTSKGMSYRDIAIILGKSPSWVSQLNQLQRTAKA